jgi:hypothetical protein
MCHSESQLEGGKYLPPTNLLAFIQASLVKGDIVFTKGIFHFRVKQTVMIFVYMTEHADHLN